MKGLGGLGAAAFIAAAVAFWFMARPNPAVVTLQVKPLSASADVPVFRGADADPQFTPMPQKTR
jgi:hypothetical protein